MPAKAAQASRAWRERRSLEDPQQEDPGEQPACHDHQLETAPQAEPGHDSYADRGPRRGRAPAQRGREADRQHDVEVQQRMMVGAALVGIVQHVGAEQDHACREHRSRARHHLPPGPVSRERHGEAQDRPGPEPRLLQPAVGWQEPEQLGDAQHQQVEGQRPVQEHALGRAVAAEELAMP
jgi:hypothetical protein